MRGQLSDRIRRDSARIVAHVGNAGRNAVRRVFSLTPGDGRVLRVEDATRLRVAPAMLRPRSWIVNPDAVSERFVVGRVQVGAVVQFRRDQVHDVGGPIVGRLVPATRGFHRHGEGGFEDGQRIAFVAHNSITPSSSPSGTCRSPSLSEPTNTSMEMPSSRIPADRGVVWNISSSKGASSVGSSPSACFAP